jgi:predicted MFS family arabinose efflux permease
MTPEERSLLERTAALAAENNKILRSIRRSNRWSAVMRVIYWVLIIGVSFGAYYYIQPWITNMIGVLDKANSIEGSVSATQGATDQLKAVLQKMQIK